jgi:hypothetical protein
MANKINRDLEPSWPLPSSSSFDSLDRDETFSKYISLEPTEISQPISLKDKAKFIPKECLEVIRDDKWMSMTSDFFGSASNICSLIGGGASTFVPYLTILSAPVCLFHAIKESHKRLRLMVVAFKVSKIAEVFFQAGRAMGCVGAALSDLIKPFAGGVILLGLSNIPAVAFTFSTLFPIILIILSVLGGASQSWALARSSSAYLDFKKKREVLNGSLESLELFLKQVEGPVPHSPAYVLEAKNWSDDCFTTDKRQKMIQQRIKNLLSFDGETTIRPVQEAIQKILPILKETQTLASEAFNHQLSPFQKIDKTLAIGNQLLEVAQDLEVEDPLLNDALADVKNTHKELQALKEILYDEGVNIGDVMKNELERKLAEQVFNVLAAALMIVSALLLLHFPNQAKLAYVLSVTSSALNVACVVLNKSISHKFFQHTQAFTEHYHLREKPFLATKSL